MLLRLFTNHRQLHSTNSLSLYRSNILYLPWEDSKSDLTLDSILFLTSIHPMTKSCAFIFSVLLLILTKPAAAGCYTSIFAFGDSFTDNGNYVLISTNKDKQQGYLPNGETYFHHPTGRCCDGRLIVDFLAEQFGLPSPSPSGAIRNSSSRGVDFAVCGARALDTSYYSQLGIISGVTNDTLRVQLGWFKDLLPFFCRTKQECEKQLKTSFVLLGPFGGNDYHLALSNGRSREETKSFAPKVTDAIISAVKELVELGVGTVMVPGLAPDGCLVGRFADYDSQNKEDYDPFTGCLIWLNKLVEYHNELLIKELDLIQVFYPQATIIYADLYNAAMQLFRFPEQYGFARTLDACCGAGGPYNFNKSLLCGEPFTSACPDPSVYIDWDGYHFTEAANRWISLGLLKGLYTIPHTVAPCNLDNPNLKLVTQV